MVDLFRAFFFKLRKDLTFRITLIVGGGVAILMMLLYMAIDGKGGIYLLPHLTHHKTSVWLFRSI